MAPTARPASTGSTPVAGHRIPALPRWHLPRPHLVDLVPPDTPVVWVVAGAGWGKTVLLREIAQRALDRGDPVAWVDLPASGADCKRLACEITRAITGASEPSMPGSTPDVVPGVASDVGSDLEAVVRVIADRVSGGCGLTVVLDDVHHISDPGVRADLAGFTRGLPPGVQLLVASRRSPAALLDGAVLDDHVQLGVGELRHTIDEVRLLMSEVLGPRIRDEVSGAVMDATEGWPALVRMHALAARRGVRADDTGRARQLVRRVVDDHVLDQVLGTLPAELRSFLLDVSVLDALTVDGCAAVAGPGLPADALDRLSEYGVPLEPLDGEGAFRLHGAVRTVARAELARRDRDHWHDVHRRAASHLIRAGAPLEAVDHLLEVSDHVAAVDVLVAAHRSIASAASRQPLAARMARFPVAVTRSDPRVAIDVALLDAQSGRFASAARTAAALRQLELVDDLRRDIVIVELAIGGILCDIDRLAALGAATDGDPSVVPTSGPGTGPQTVADAPVGSDLRSDGGASAALRADTWPAAPIALLLADRFEECDTACRRAERAGSTLLADPLTNLGARAFLSAWRGRLREAAPAADAARRHPAAAGPSAAPARARRASAELLLRLEVGDPAEVAADAMQLVDELASECERHTTLDVPIAVIALRAWRFADEPSRAFDGSVPLVTSTPTIARPWLTSLIAEELVRCACDLGGVTGIATAERALGQVRGPLATALARAHVLVARHEHAAARSVLAGLDMLEIARHSPVRAIDLGVLQHRTATTSRELAGTLHAVRAIADQHAVQRSLDAMLDRGVRSGSTSTATRHTDRPEPPLSSRELEVLRLLPTDLPTTELAQQLFVSVNTVKTHMKSIYRKLDATGRVDAVRRARELGVLPPRA